MTSATATPADFARWGAALGFQTGKDMRAKPNRAARRFHLARCRQVVAETCASYLRDGASGDEARLYREAFEAGVKGAQLGMPVKILTADGPIEVGPTS